MSLLGQVSEGAWWRLAERFRSRSTPIAKALDEGRTSTAVLIKLTVDELSSLKGMKTVAAELHSHATYLRELRNYGVHPLGADSEATEEHAFTEAGCSFLLLSTHRYLEKLGNLP